MKTITGTVVVVTLGTLFAFNRRAQGQALAGAPVFAKALPPELSAAKDPNASLDETSLARTLLFDRELVRHLFDDLLRRSKLT